MDEALMSRAIARISFEIIERNRGAESLCIIGLLRRGAVLAERIAQKIEEVEGRIIPVGTLDISPFRDDRRTKTKEDISDIPFLIQNCNIVLVDDVISTGRSTRAAIEAILSRGRTKSIQLAVLIDRGHRELPIRPDYVGKNVPTSRSEYVQVNVKEYDGINTVLIVDGPEETKIEP